MLRSFIIRLAALVAFVAAIPAHATDIYTYTITGTVNNLVDTAGIFPNPQPGTGFTLVYTADFTRGMISGGGGGLAGGVSLFGGSSFPPDPNLPNLSLSPVSAALTIGGTTLTFGGGYLGSLSATFFAGELIGGVNSSSLELISQDGGDPTSNSIDTTVGSTDSFALYSDTLRYSNPIAIDGVHIVGQSTFTYNYAVPGTSLTSVISGTLNLSSFVNAAAPAPEPAEWALLVCGFGAVGVALRRTRRLPAATLA